MELYDTKYIIFPNQPPNPAVQRSMFLPAVKTAQCAGLFQLPLVVAAPRRRPIHATRTQQQQWQKFRKRQQRRQAAAAGHAAFAAARREAQSIHPSLPPHRGSLVNVWCEGTLQTPHLAVRTSFQTGQPAGGERSGRLSQLATGVSGMRLRYRRFHRGGSAPSHACGGDCEPCESHRHTAPRIIQQLRASAQCLRRHAKKARPRISSRLTASTIRGGGSNSRAAPKPDILSALRRRQRIGLFRIFMHPACEKSILSRSGLIQLLRRVAPTGGAFIGHKVGCGVCSPRRT